MQYDFMNGTELSSLEVLVGIAFASQRGILPQPPPMPDKGYLENTEREASMGSQRHLFRALFWCWTGVLVACSNCFIASELPQCQCDVVFILLPMSLPVPYVI